MAFELHHLTAQEQWDWIRRGDTTATELARHYLDRIERLNGELGAYSRVDADRALALAAEVDAHGPSAAPLAGVPVAEKELARRAGTISGSGSRLTADQRASRSDAIITALDATGAVSLGATTAPEFGLVGFTEPVGRPPALNPWDLATGAGGSSGGAAAAVAAGLAPFAVGSDGGGSIRIPAAVCGVVGVKPSRGRVRAQGGQDWLGGLVTAGPIARTVADAAMLLDALVRPDGLPPKAAFSLVPPGGDEPFLGHAVRGEGRFSVAVLEGTPWDDDLDIRIDPGNRAAVERTVDALDALGHGVEVVRLPEARYPDFFRVLWEVGAAAIPAETREQLDLLEPYTREMVERGRRLPARRVVEALGAAAAFERALIERFAPFDAVLTPTIGLSPRPLGWYTEEPGADACFARQVQAAPLTSFVNVSGLPAITLPVGAGPAAAGAHSAPSTGEPAARGTGGAPAPLGSDGGRPEGVQLIGRPGGEAALFALGRQLERRFGWQRRHPPAFW